MLSVRHNLVSAITDNNYRSSTGLDALFCFVLVWLRLKVQLFFFNAIIFLLQSFLTEVAVDRIFGVYFLYVVVTTLCRTWVHV